MSEFKALLLTDVVGSTQLSERLGDAAMAGVWAAHDRVARELLPAWRGREIDKTDGMLLMFDSVSDAVKYARACQRALAALPVPLPARAGIHYGPVILRENSAADIARGAKPLEVDGLAKPTAARVMALAAGGQLLLTPEARQALGETTLHPQSHGHWVLKGLSEPVELFEVAEDAAACAVPADGEKAYRVVRSGERWLPVHEIPNNLPHQTSSFIGRELELRELKSHLPQVRLLTLLGMGGLGKTRLSLQVAAEVQPLYPDGVWFVDLSPIRDPALVAAATAQVLGLRDEPDRPLVQALCAHLRLRHVLLVLDNCEHLMQAAAELAHALLGAAAGLRILASSREALRVPGELAYPVRPLPVPERGAGLATLLQSTAVRLFVERARLQKPGFKLDEREAPAVAELVGRLEGIPLALELAAARVRSLSVADINLRLRDRYKLLTGGARTLQHRQQTLRALVDWSYDLLSPQEQSCLQRLGVFAGGFDLAAAEAVCGADPLDALDIVDLLGSLVDKSLATMDEQPEGSRYRMLETIREYANEKLALSGDAQATAARHGEYFFALAKAGRDGIKGQQQAEWIWRLEAELDNLRAASTLALAGGIDQVIAVKLAVALQGFWILRGYISEGRKLVRDILALPAVRAYDRAHAHALYVGAALAGSQGDQAEARTMLETCLALRRSAGEPVEIAATLSTLAYAQLAAGDEAAARANETEALQLFRGRGDQIGEAIGLLHLGQIDAYGGRAANARGHFDASLALARRISHVETVSDCELGLGELALDDGDAGKARACFQRALLLCRESADRRGEANALRALGRADLLQGDTEKAGQRLAEALAAFDAQEMRAELIGCLDDHARLHAAGGHPELAARLAAAAENSRKRHGLARSAQASRQRDAWLDALRNGLSAQAWAEAQQAGERWELAEAVQAARGLMLAPA